MARLPGAPLALPEEDGIQQHAERHRRIRLALVLDQEADQRPDVLRFPERQAEKEVGLAAAPALQEELAAKRLQSGEVEAIDEVGQERSKKVTEVRRVREQAADR